MRTYELALTSNHRDIPMVSSGIYDCGVYKKVWVDIEEQTLIYLWTEKDKTVLEISTGHKPLLYRNDKNKTQKKKKIQKGDT